MLKLKLTALGFVAFGLAACTLPQAGPTVTQMERGGDPNVDVYLVKVSAPVVRLLSQHRSDGFPGAFLRSAQPSVVMRPGDIVGISIYESGSTPLFGTTSPTTSAPITAAPTTLPPQLIESDGQVLVPYVGRVRVSGRTPSQAADEIARLLGAQTVKPQVIVSLVSNNSNTVAVGGEVNKAGLVPLTLRGERLLDVIALAGGPRYPALEVDVRMIRGNTVAAIPLQHVLANPQDNIVVQPNDNVVLVRNPKTFVVLGAATKVAQYNMDAERVTLAEGVARAGGTIDTFGNLAGIFVLRSEPSALARAVIMSDYSAVDATFVQTDETRTFAGPQTRMMYRIDLTQPHGYFFAQNMELRDKDIVLMANAETAQIQKAVALVRSFTGIIFDLNRSAVAF